MTVNKRVTGGRSSLDDERTHEPESRLSHGMFLNGSKRYQAAPFGALMAAHDFARRSAYEIHAAKKGRPE